MPTSPLRAARARRPGRRSTPSCRGGVSSLLRLAQPVGGRTSVGIDVTGWLARAASVLTPVAAPALPVRPSEFAPSQWLIGH